MVGRLRARAVVLLVSAAIAAQAAVGTAPASAAGPGPSAAPSGAPAATASPSAAPPASPTDQPPAAATPSATPSTAPSPAATPAPTVAPAPLDAPPPAGARAGATEVASRRTETSATWDNHDGTYTTQFYAQPAFYRPAGSTAYQPIQPGFAQGATADPLTGLVPAATSSRAPVAVSLFDAGAKDFISVRSARAAVGFALPAALAKDAHGVKPTVTDGHADYAGILAGGAGLRVFAGPSGSKSFIVLASAPKVSSWTFRLDAPGLTPVLRDGGYVDLVDASGAVQAWMPQPYAVDSAYEPLRGGGVTYDGVRLSLGRDADGAPTVTISVNPSVLAAAAYPLYVDPSVQLRGTSDVADAHVSSGYPTHNYASYKRPDSPYCYEMWLGQDPSGPSGTSYDLIRFDLSSVPTAATVDSASVGMYAYHQYYNAPTVERTWVTKLNSSWSESSVTWSAHPSYVNTNLTFIDAVEGQYKTSASSSTFNAMVQDWVTNPGHNYGLREWENGEGATYWKRQYSSEQGGSNRPTLDVTYHLPDTTPPSVASFTAPATPTSASSLAYALAFSEPVTGLAASDFAVSGTATGWTPSVSGSGSSYTVTLGGGGSGTVILTLNAATVDDPAGNHGPAGPVPAPTVTVDRTPPSVASFTAPATPTSASSLAYALAFSEPVTGLAASDFAVSGTATGWTPSVSGSGSSYTVTLGGGGSGTVILTLNAATVDDPAGNHGPAGPVPAPTVTVDRTGPAITTFRLQAGSDTGASSSDGKTNATSLVYDLWFNEAVTGVDVADISRSGTATCSSEPVVAGSGSVYTVTVDGCSEGTVTLTFAANGATDPASNAGPAAAVAAPTVTVDRTAPAAPSVPVLDPVSDTGTPGDGVTRDATPTFGGGAEADATVTLHDGSDAVGSGVATEGSWSVTSSPLTPDGVHGITATATDLAGNESAPSAALVVVVDTAAPAVQSFAAPASPTGAETLVYALDFGEPVYGLDASDFTVGGTADGWSVSSVDGAGPYTVTLADGGEGTVTLSLNPQAADDLAGNAGPASAAAAAAVQVDPAPRVLSFAAPSSPTSASSLEYVIDFDEPVTGLGVSDFAVGGSAAGWTLSPAITGSGAGPYTVALVGGDEGTVILTLAANAVAGSSGAAGPAGAAGAQTVIVDRTAPSVSSLSAPASPTSATELTFSLSFTEAVTGLSASDVAVGGSATGWSVSSVSGAGVGPYSIILDGGTPGTVSLALQTGSVDDAAANEGPLVTATSAAVTVEAPSGAPSTPDMSASSDSGASPTDNLTNVPAPVFTGRAMQPDGVVTLMDGDAVIGTGTSSDGVWTIASSHLDDGLHSVYAVELDGGQPASAPSSALTVVIDTSAPAIEPESPAIGATDATGATSFDVSWTATDAGAVASASVARDSRPMSSGVCSGQWSEDHGGQAGASPFHDAGLVLETCYRWRVTAVDAAGNAATGTTGTVTVGDAALSSPVAGDSAFSVETLTVQAQPSAGVSRVEFLVDGVQVASSASAPYAAPWDTSAVPAGAHDVQARVVYGDGSSELLPSIAVTVNNALSAAERVAEDEARGVLTGSQSALYRVLAYADQAALPARYQSAFQSSLTDSVSVLSAAEYGQLNPTDKAAVDAVLLDDLRGLARDHAAGTTVGRQDPKYTECTHIYHPKTHGATYYCVHEVPGFRIVYWLDNGSVLPDGQRTGGVEDVDLVSDSVAADGTLVSTPDSVPDTVDTVAVALELARSQFSQMGYRLPPGTQYVLLRPDVPCGGGCTEKFPWMAAPEISLPDKIGVTSDPQHPTWDAWWIPRHEYFHAVQDQYNVPAEVCRPEFCRDDENSVWAEATAEWAAHQVDASSPQPQQDQLHSYSRKLAGYLGRTDLAFKDMDASTQRQYGVFVLASYLQQTHGSDSIRRSWERIADGRSPLEAIGAEDGNGLSGILRGFAVATNSMSFGDPDNRFPQPPAAPDSASWVGRLESFGYRPARTPTSPVVLATGITRTLSSIPTLGNPSPELRDLGPGGFSLTDLAPSDPSGGILQVDIAGPFDSVSPLGAELVATDAAGLTCAESAAAGGHISLALSAGDCRNVTLVIWNADPWVNSVTASATFRAGAVLDDFNRTVGDCTGRAGWGNGWTTTGGWETITCVDGSAAHYSTFSYGDGGEWAATHAVSVPLAPGPVLTASFTSFDIIGNSLAVRLDNGTDSAMVTWRPDQYSENDVAEFSATVGGVSGGGSTTIGSHPGSEWSSASGIDVRIDYDGTSLSASAVYEGTTYHLGSVAVGSPSGPWTSVTVSGGGGGETNAFTIDDIGVGG